MNLNSILKLVFIFLLQSTIAQDISAVELFPQINTIQAATNYELKMLLSKAMPINTKIKLDFSATDIVVADSALSECVNIDVFDTSKQTQYTDCSCASKLCTIIIPQQINSGNVFLLRFGTLTNPDFVKTQVVSLSVDFGSSSVSTASVYVDVYSAGALIKDSLAQSSQKVAATDDVLLELHNEHTITKNGLLLIQFPSQIVFKNAQVKCSINGQSAITGTVTYSTSSISVSGLFVSVAVNPNTPITLQILNLQNQESVRVSNSITLQTATAQNYLIDALDFTIETTIPESIVIDQIQTTDSSAVNAIATYQFTLSPAIRFINGGYLEITIPSQLTIQSDMSCIRILGLTTITGNSYSCTASSQIIRTNNLQYPNLSNALILIVSKIKNPSTMKPTDTFIFKTFDVDGSLICVSSASSPFTATYDILTASLVRSVTTVGVTSKYTLKVTNKNQIPSGGAYILKIGSSQAYKNTITCTIAGQAQQCTWMDDTTIKFLAQATASSVSIEIEINSLINPNFVVTSTSDIEVSTQDAEAYGIDRLESVPVTPVLTPISMASISFFRNNDVDSQVDIGSQVVLKLKFDMPSQYAISNDGNAIIDLKGYYWKLSSDTLLCQQTIDSNKVDRTCSIQSYIAQDTPSMNLISKIKINNINSNHQASIELLISGIRSQLDSGNTSQIIQLQVTTLGNGLMGEGVNSMGTTTFVNNQVTLSTIDITSDSQITGIITQYQLDILIKYPLDIATRNAKISIAIPTEIGVENGANCLATLGSQTLVCQISNQIITITSSLDPYTFIDKHIIVTISQLRNPNSTEKTSNWIINQNYQSKTSVQYNKQSQVNQPRGLTATMIKQTTLVNQSNSFQLSFSLDNAVTTLTIQLTIPKDQIVEQTLQIVKGSIVIASQKTYDASNNVILKFQESSCPCLKATALSYTISGFNNPNSTQTLSSKSSLILYNSNGNIYQQNLAISLEGMTCPKQYYVDATYQCQQCSSNCLSCDVTGCKQCENNYHLSSENKCQSIDCSIQNCQTCIFNSSQTMVCSQCKDTFELYNGNCYNQNDCTFTNCEVCLISNQKTSCSTCSANYSKYQDQCVQQCPDGLYSNNRICVSCSNGCSKCDQATGNCLECSAPYVLSNSSCNCPQSNCKTCTNEKVCTSCQDNYKFYNNTCLDQCPQKYYVSGQSCLPCSTNCESCDNNNNCTQCQQDYFIQDGVCVDIKLRVCPAGTYKDSQYICQQCSTNCQVCDSTGCQQCQLNYEFNKNKECVMICYLDQCSQCSIQSNPLSQSCEKCKGEYEIYQGKCYQKNNCYLENCDTCQIQNQKLICQKCSEQYYNMSGQCLTECPQGYYIQDQVCLQCSQGCQACESQSKCQSCLDIYNLVNGKCQCQVNNCQSCSQQNICDMCNEGLIYYNNECLQECPQAYYQDSETCLKCGDNCLTCNKQNTCQVCSDNYYLMNEQCHQKQCGDNCVDCQEQCNQCESGYTLVSGDCIITKHSEFGIASYTLMSIIAIGLTYLFIQLAIPPYYPLLQQVIICSLIMLGFIQSIGSIVILIYCFIKQDQIIFILFSIGFCSSTLINSLPSIYVPNMFLQIFSGGSIFRIGMSKFKFLQQSKDINEYIIIRYSTQYYQIFGNLISFLCDIIVVALWSPNESPYLGILKLGIDTSQLLILGLEYRLL